MAKKTTYFDFGDGNGPVPAYRHKNKGVRELGGWVARTATVGKDVYVHPTAKVYGRAYVSDSAHIGSYAEVFGTAKIYDRASIEISKIYGSARLYNDAWIETSKIYGTTCIEHGANIRSSDLGCGFFGGSIDIRNVLLTTKQDQDYVPYIYGIMRTDGFSFVAMPTKDGIRVMAGCRYFSFKEAKEHWKRTRGGTRLGKETMAILKLLEEKVKLYGYAG